MTKKYEKPVQLVWFSKRFWKYKLEIPTENVHFENIHFETYRERTGTFFMRNIIIILDKIVKSLEMIILPLAILTK